MELDFVKLNGIGNDFIFFDDFSCDIDLGASQVKRLCDRHFGIGADGVILVQPPREAGCAAYMHYINSDGSLAEMCGNGIRCFAKYLVDRGYVCAHDGSFLADTLSGPKEIAFEVDGEQRMRAATVNMGHPILDPALVPVAAPSNAVSAQGVRYLCEMPLESEWGTFAFTCVSMGNPHAVCFIDDWDALADSAFSDPTNKCLATFDVARIGAYFESHEVFPEKSNIEFASAGTGGLHMRVYERGCAETLACGTGACALSVAATLTGRTGRENDVHLLGGCLHISWHDDNCVMMEGPAAESFRGSVCV